MSLEPLEFSDCLTDSPLFRDKLHAHEKELKKTNKAIKGLIVQCREVLQASANLSKAQRNLAKTLSTFQCEGVIGQKTEDEIDILESLSEFGKLIDTIEEERERMLGQADVTVISSLENFRKDCIMKAKEKKKKYFKEYERYTQSLDKSLKQNRTADKSVESEADAAVAGPRYKCLNEGMEYVQLLQEVEERKKFEFVEILLQFISGWFTFYHQGYEVANDFRDYKQDLSLKLQKCRANFESTRSATDSLRLKMLQYPLEHRAMCQQVTREGYLQFLEKKPFGSSWVKAYCQYKKSDRTLTISTPSLTPGKSMNTETWSVVSCTRRPSDSIERRFCFDAILTEKPCVTFQAMSDDDLHSWMDAMDGKEPIYSIAPFKTEKTENVLNEIGFKFVKECIRQIELRGVEDEGLYRIVGAASQVGKMAEFYQDEVKASQMVLDDIEVKTMTSGLKAYLRSLNEPIMTYSMYDSFLSAAKMETRTAEAKTTQVECVRKLVQQLPPSNYDMLRMLMLHLRRVSEHSHKNLMTVANLGICFGPTLMWSKTESVAALMDIKFTAIVVELLVNEYDTIFKTGTEVPFASNKQPEPAVTQSTGAATTALATNMYGGRQLTPFAAAGPKRTAPLAEHLTSAASSAQIRPTATKNAPLPVTPRITATPLPAPPVGRKPVYDRLGQPILSMVSPDISAPPSSPVIGRSATMKGASSSPVLGRRAITLFDCRADGSNELSFNKDELVYNVKPSDESGWMTGTIAGKRGLIPENYIRFV